MRETVRNLQSGYNVQWNCCRVLLSNFQLLCPSKLHCCCFRPTKRDRIFMRGYRSLEKETHITYVLKHIRVIKGILKAQMT